MTDLTEAPFFNTRLLHEPRDWATGRIRASVVRYADRPPDEIIGDPGRPHFNRWHMIQRNRWLNVYAHQFLRSDDDRALHDHHWPSISLVLCGSYIEHEIKAGGVHVMTMRKTGDLIFRMPSSAHRIELPADSTTACWTLFITGPKVREWGFHCPDRWSTGATKPDPCLIVCNLTRRQTLSLQGAETMEQSSNEQGRGPRDGDAAQLPMQPPNRAEQ